MGRLTFPAFLEFRRERLRKLKEQIDQISVPEMPDSPDDARSAKSTIYVGNAIRNWPTGAPRNITWLCTSPVVGRPTFPIFLDAAESAKRSGVHSNLVELTCSALAPTWEELSRFGITDKRTSHPRWDDVDGDADDILNEFLINALTRGIASLGPSYGIVFRHPERYDEVSGAFVLRLLREASLTGFHIALEGSIDVLLTLRYGRYFKAFNAAGEPSNEKPCNPDFDGSAIRVVAMCPHGMPRRVLGALGLNLPDCCMSCEGPGGEAWVAVPPIIRRRVLAHMPPKLKRETNLKIFDAWPPCGWGYLRRNWHVIAAQDVTRHIESHTSYVCGASSIGRSFLRDHFTSLAKRIEQTRLYRSHMLHALTGAARINALGSRKAEIRAALNFCRRTLVYATPTLSADIIYLIAGLYARGSSPGELIKGQRWCKRGLDIVSRISSRRSRLYARIKLLNMSALIAYRRFQNQEALELEYQARDLAKLAGVEFADIQSWAMPIVNANLARLRERRFDDTASAVALFEENLRVDNPLVREHASIELARLYFDKGQYQRVVALLRAAPDGPWSSSFSEKRELFAQLMFGIASQALGEPASKQRQRLFYLLYAQDKPGATEFIRKLKQSELGRS